MKTTTSVRRHSLRILAGSICALLAVQSVRADRTITNGNEYVVDETNLTQVGNVATWNETGTLTIFDGATFQNAQIHDPLGLNFLEIDTNVVFTGNAGTITLNLNDNDMAFNFNGTVSSTATGPQTLRINTGYLGNGDRQEVNFDAGIPNAAGGSALSLHVRFSTQSGSQSYVNLKGANTFTGPITLENNNASSAYLTIGGELTRNGNTVGSGSLGNGSYAGAISLDTNTILHYTARRRKSCLG